MKEKRTYPFAAIVGQTQMKKALLLNIINPQLGGVLIRGEKGTAKSTAVRALVDLMSDRLEVEGCPFSCDPNDLKNACESCAASMIKGEKLPAVMRSMRVVELPVSATEDRVVGTMDLEHAIKHGEKRFEPGILAQANRNILYVDEVNLLDDHVVDILLDSAAMGVSTIEREGISYTHPARFTLIGTMNPEEGDLRPQLIDRFALVVDVVGEEDLDQRVQVIQRRLAYESNPEEFAKTYAKEQQQLSEQIARAIELLPQVELDTPSLKLAAQLAVTLGVDGHRADITTIKAAMTLAALDGRIHLMRSDMAEAAALALPHRMRRHPFDDVQVNVSDAVEAILAEYSDGEV